MADTWLIPGGPAIQESKDSAVWVVPGVVAVQEATAEEEEKFIPQIIIF